MPGKVKPEGETKDDRSIVRCSGAAEILANFSGALNFLWLLSLFQDKESDTS